MAICHGSRVQHLSDLVCPIWAYAVSSWDGQSLFLLTQIDISSVDISLFYEQKRQTWIGNLSRKDGRDENWLDLNNLK